jgi:hypothetical protein
MRNLWSTIQVSGASRSYLGGHPIAIRTASAIWQIRALLKEHRGCRGSIRDSFLTTVTSSPLTQERLSPVSPGDRRTCVGTSCSMEPVNGATNTVLARGCLFLASREIITTGRSALSGGSVWSLTYQISPRPGMRFMSHSSVGNWVSANLPQARSSRIWGSVSAS